MTTKTLPAGFVVDKLPEGFIVDNNEASATGKRFTGGSPDRPLFAEPKRPIPDAIKQQLAVGFGDDKGKVKFLKNIFEDAQLNKNGALTVKDNGKWYFFNRPGPSVSDIGNLPGQSLVPAGQAMGSTVGFGLGAATGNPAAAFLGGTGGGALGGGGAEALRQAIGLQLGTQSQFSLSSIGSETFAGGVMGGVGSAVSLARSPINPKIKGSDSRRLYEVGKKVDTGLEELRKEAGKAVRAERDVVEKQMTGYINTTDIVAKLRGALEAGKTPGGISKWSAADQRAMNEVIDVLSENHGRVSPKTLQIAKDIIDRTVTYSSNYAKTIANVSDPAEALLKSIRSGVDGLLQFHDLQPELGGTGGRLAEVNARYAKVMNLYEGAQKVLGNDFNLSKKMSTVGEELIKDNPAYTDLFTQLNDMVSPKHKFLDQLNFTVKGIRAERAARNLTILGTKPAQVLETGKAVGDAFMSRPAPKLLSDLLSKPLSFAGEKIVEPSLQLAAQKPVVPQILLQALKQSPQIMRQLGGQQ